jgi:hypothetical protein
MGIMDIIEKFTENKPIQNPPGFFMKTPSGTIGFAIKKSEFVNIVANCEQGTCPGQAVTACGEGDYNIQVSQEHFNKFKVGPPFTCDMMNAKESFANYGGGSIVEGMESQWTKQISSKTICDWFYIFFIFNAVFVGLLFISLFSTVSGNTRIRLLQVLPAAAIGAINVLFWYLICERSNMS